MSTIYGSPVMLGGGSKIPQNLPPLNPNFRLELSGTTVTITANKLPKNDNTAMLAGGVWVLDSKMPESPKDAIVKQWTGAELIDATQTEESKETVTWTYTWTKGEPVYCRQYTYNPKGQYNTTVMGGVASTLSKPPFALPEFTGNHAIFGDEASGRVELYESGTLTLHPGTYDLFLVGGGASGAAQNRTGSSWNDGGGGGSGYTKTIKSVTVNSVLSIPTTIGAGGSVALPGTVNSATAVNPGSVSSLLHNKLPGGGFTVMGGTNENYRDSDQYAGTNGGSGGGYCYGGFGGSDGSYGRDGANKPLSFAAGQGTTTRAFEEPSGTLYAGAGGGGNHLEGSGEVKVGEGGSGGGGNGGTYGDSSKYRRSSTPGTANTGGGGGGGSMRMSSSTHGPATGAAGGSGIIIIRWNNT